MQYGGDRPSLSAADHQHDDPVLAPNGPPEEAKKASSSFIAMIWIACRTTNSMTGQAANGHVWAEAVYLIDIK